MARLPCLELCQHSSWKKKIQLNIHVRNDHIDANPGPYMIVLSSDESESETQSDSQEVAGTT